MSFFWLGILMAVSGKHLFSTEVVLFFFIHGLKPVATKLVDPMGLPGGGAVFAVVVVFTPAGCKAYQKKAQYTVGACASFLSPRRDLNPHLHCCKQDFKSCVSTNSTTRGSQKKTRKIREFFNGAEDEIRTRDLNLGKVALYQLSYFRICHP